MKRSLICLAAGIVLAFAFAASGASAQILDKKALSLAQAKKIAGAALAEAAKNKWNYVVAIVDADGNLIYFERTDGAQVASVRIAQEKARSAAIFKRPTKAFQDRVEKGATFLLGLPGAVVVAGGVPIEYQGQVIGAIGASGGTPDEDVQVDTAGIAALGK